LFLSKTLDSDQGIELQLGSKYFHFKTTLPTAPENQHSAVSTALHAGEQANVCFASSWQKLDLVLSKSAPPLIQRLLHCTLAISLEVKRTEHEAETSPPSSADMSYASLQ
jgi:hypothetical protein